MENLINAIADLKEQEAIELVEQRLSDNEDPLKILDDTKAAMAIVGQRFADSDYFMPDLVYSGEILKQIADMVKPKLQGKSEANRIGKCIIGTVAGDIHDIGKDIVTFMLDVNNFEVIDLGIDVPPQVFVDKINETGASVVGLSGFLTLAFDTMKETIEAIEAAGLRDKVKIMIGGGQIDEVIMEYTGADAYGTDAMSAVSFAREWLQ